MKKRLYLVIVMVSLLSLAVSFVSLPTVSQAAPTFTVYDNDRPGWEGAVGVYDEEFFTDATLNPGVSVVSTYPGYVDTTNGVWYDVLDLDPPTTTTWQFSIPIIGFGGEWNCEPDGYGTGIEVAVNGSWVTVGEIPDNYVNQFWGFVATEPFTQVRLQAGSYSGTQETYELDNMVYSYRYCPEGCSKMHFPQLPDLENGLDIRANNPQGGEDHYVADDFLCVESGPITDIHVWGSWKDDILPWPPPDDELPWFNIQIYSDNRDTDLPYSRPGARVWHEFEIRHEDDPGAVWWKYYTVEEVATGLNERFYDPSTGETFPDTKVYKYNFYFDPVEAAFYQTAGNIYWLEVQECSRPLNWATWGWKTTLNHFEDDAVWATDVLPGHTWPTMDWQELIHPVTMESLDMAFDITGLGITLEKTADADPAVCGHPFAYTYEVETCGADLTDVSVTDDNCASPVLVSGDTNGNSILEFGETWIYECQYVPTIDDAIAGSVSNTATARGTRTDPGDPPVDVVVCDEDDLSVEVVSGSSIEFCKVTIPKDPLKEFDFTGDLGPFTLTDDPCGCVTFVNPPPGDYTVTEVLPLPTSWYLKDISCTGGNCEPFGDSGITIHLGCNEHVCCTFINEEKLPEELPPPTPGGPVGITVMPMDKAGLLLPWAALAGLTVLVSGTWLFVKRRLKR